MSECNDEFVKVIKPVIEYLKNNHYPHEVIVVADEKVMTLEINDLIPNNSFNEEDERKETIVRRIGKAIDYLMDNEDISSGTDAYPLIEDVILTLANDKYLSSSGALDILSDAKKIIPLISTM